MPESKLAEELGLTDEDLEAMDLDENIIFPDTGGSGEMIYSYYFNVPKETPTHILAKKGWSVGQRVEIDLHYFEEPDEPERE